MNTTNYLNAPNAQAAARIVYRNSLKAAKHDIKIKASDLYWALVRAAKVDRTQAKAEVEDIRSRWLRDAEDEAREDAKNAADDWTKANK